MKICIIGSGSIALGLLCPWLSRLSDTEISVITRAARDAAERNDYRATLRARREYRLDTAGENRTEPFPHELLEYTPEDLESPASQQCVTHLASCDVGRVGIPYRSPATCWRLARELRETT